MKSLMVLGSHLFYEVSGSMHLLPWQTVSRLPRQLDQMCNHVTSSGGQNTTWSTWPWPFTVSPVQEMFVFIVPHDMETFLFVFCLTGNLYLC